MKKILIVAATLVIIFGGAMIALVTLINPNDFKAPLVNQVARKTGLELVIPGNIRWHFFPSPGFSLGMVELRNPDGYSKVNLFRASKLDVDLSLLPLLQRKLDIQNITLQGVALNIESLQNGQRNIDAFKHPEKQTQPAAKSSRSSVTATTASKPAQDMSRWQIQVAGITVNNARLSVYDARNGIHAELSDIALHLTGFEFDKWAQADFSFNGQNNQYEFTAQGQLELNLSRTLQNFQLRAIDIESSITDQLNHMETLQLSSKHFSFATPSDVNVSFVGKSGDISYEGQGGTQVSINQALDQFTLHNLAVSATLQGVTLAQSPLSVSLNSQFAFSASDKKANWQLDSLQVNDNTLNGHIKAELTKVPNIEFALHSSHLNLDALSGSSKKRPAKSARANNQPKAETSLTQSSQQEPNLAFLNKVQAKGTLNVEHLQLANAKIKDVTAKLALADGVLNFSDIQAKLYQGALTAQASLDSRHTPVRYQVKTQLKDVQLQTLLSDTTGSDFLQGQGSIAASLQGQSLIAANLWQNLQGTLHLDVQKGALQGVDLAHFVNADKNANSTKTSATEFSSLQGSIALQQGVATTDNLLLVSPVIHILGQGKADYVQRRADVIAKLSLPKKPDDALPLHISGPWDQLKYKLVVDDGLKQKAQQELQRGVDKLADKINDKKTQKAVDKLLKGLLK